MRLLRIVIMTFTPAPWGWKTFKVERGDASLRTQGILGDFEDSENRRTLIVAEIPLSEPPALTEDGYVTVPDDPRRSLEQLIESTAALIAVTSQCKHSISSVWPCVALVADSEQERSFLEASDGLDVTTQQRISFRQQIPSSSNILSRLEDRLDGVSLLAGVFAQDNPLGRYRELIRFFELAFAMPSSQFSKKLTQFLVGASLGYSRPEVNAWCELRHGAMHGDSRRTATLVLEADVRPCLARMEQAALDVLLNKLEWHSNSRERRSLWAPNSGTTSLDGQDMMIVQGTESTMKVQTLDAFLAYPMNLEGMMTSPPADWFVRTRGSRPDSTQDEPDPT